MAYRSDDEMRALYAGSLRGGSDEDDSTFEGSSAGLGRPQLMPDSYSIMPQGLTPARFHSRLHRYTSHPHLVEGHEAACPQAVAQGLRCASARDPQGETTKSAPHFGAATSVALYRIYCKFEHKSLRATCTWGWVFWHATEVASRPENSNRPFQQSHWRVPSELGAAPQMPHRNREDHNGVARGGDTHNSRP